MGDLSYKNMGNFYLGINPMTLALLLYIRGEHYQQIMPSILSFPHTKLILNSVNALQYCNTVCISF